MDVVRPTVRPAESFIVLPGMKPTYNTSDPHGSSKPVMEKRLAGLGWVPNKIRHLVIACIGEFVGTFLFLFFAYTGTQVANNLLGDNPMNVGTLIYISLSFGFSLMVNVWVFFRISGGLFNPAVTIAMALIGAVDWIKAGLLIVTQIVGGIAAAGIVSVLFPGPLSVRTTLSSGTSITRGLFIEMFLTAQLVFCIFMLAAEKHRSTFLAPIGIGFSLFIAELAGVYYTGGSLNPARSFGPSVILGRFYSYHWIYWVGPLLGSLVAVIFYRLIKVLEYETANPDAESDGHDHAHSISSRPNTGNTGNGLRPMSSGDNMDGTDERDFASQFNRPARKMAHRSTTANRLSHHNNASAETAVGNPITPPAAHKFGGDGYRTDSASNSPATVVPHVGTVPRSNNRFSSHTEYEMANDVGYRSGPSTESGGRS
ncbi:aquaporin [Dothidotthia symphoricarpi CBS 119687]|uniref:Aquaporin n=1 Tax=Dothidotthia symphoricarpi CBS 119687 TaxID=1392245 RepID=A0A6A6AMK1_9PLEO|nr:aquaporin [Dothidotthia symphoricarpi CBS 119687]KAF2132403.1 aquaporin [Dothidotthia symphoricarpi CBS 119687]